jgi:hypothetical protein
LSDGMDRKSKADEDRSVSREDRETQTSSGIFEMTFCRQPSV